MVFFVDVSQGPHRHPWGDISVLTMSSTVYSFDADCIQGVFYYRSSPRRPSPRALSKGTSSKGLSEGSLSKGPSQRDPSKGLHPRDPASEGTPSKGPHLRGDPIQGTPPPKV